MVAADFSGFLFWRFGCVGCAANGCKIGNITTCWWNQDDFALSIFTGIIHSSAEKIRSLWERHLSADLPIFVFISVAVKGPNYPMEAHYPLKLARSLNFSLKLSTPALSTYSFSSIINLYSIADTFS